MNRAIVSFFAMLLLLWCGISPAFAGDVSVSSVATTRSFALDKGDSLWSDWKKLSQPRPAWAKYWKDTCALSHIPCTDKAWRYLPVGQVIVTPRAAKDIDAEVQRIVTARNLAADKELAALRSELESMRIAEATLRAQIEEWKSRLFAVVTLSLIGVLALLFRIYLKSEDRIVSNEHVGTADSALSTQDVHVPPPLSTSASPHRPSFDPDFPQPPSDTTIANEQRPKVPVVSHPRPTDKL